jgi:hypothetical protein
MGPSRDFFERYRLIVETNAAWDRPTQHCFPGLRGIYDYDSFD